MTMRVKKKLWVAVIIVFTVLLAGSSFPAAPAPQEPARPPISEEERKKVLERLSKQIQESQQGAKQPAGIVTQQPQPAGSAAVPSAAPPSSSIQRDSGKVQLSYENADLYDFINQIGSMLGITPIVIDPEVKGSVTIQSTAPMARDDVLPLFNLMLKSNNAALIKQGDIYQIVPISSALKKGVEVIEHLPPADAAKPESSSPKTGAEPPATPAAPAPKTSGPVQAAPKPPPPAAKTQAPQTDASRIPRLATHIIRVEFVPVKDLIEPIKLFMTDGGVIMPYERTNMLILTDYSDSADRIVEIIHLLDNSYLDEKLVDLIKINNNASADVVEDLKKIFGSGTKDSATGISFVSLDRLNAIFVMANSKRGFEAVKRWIKELDSSTGRNIQTYVYVVENSTASNIAMMLSALYGGEGAAGDTSTTAGGAGGYYSGTSRTGGRSAQASGMQGGTVGTSGSALGGSANQFGGTTGGFSGTSGYQGGYSSGTYPGGGYMGGNVFAGGQQLGPRLDTAPSITSQILRGGVFTGLQDTVRMVVDNVNNSLIIQATPADYAYIKETIIKMDVLPRQVLIDARVFEVDLTDALSFGVSATLQGRTDGSKGEHSTGTSLDPTTGALSLNTFAFIGDSRQLLMGLNALREKTKVRILEAPSVLALDGTEAHIVVGSEVPFPGTSFTQAVGGTTTSVQYRDTGVSLIVQPRISASGSVTLDIVQEVSSPGAATATGPTFSKTYVRNTFSVKDGETVAIAGLIRDSNRMSRGGFPLLSDLPILGSLFGQTNRSTARSEVIILITPHVIRTPERFQEMTQELKDSLRNVRKYADEKDQEHIEDMEGARKDRYNQEQERMEKSTPPKRKK